MLNFLTKISKLARTYVCSLNPHDVAIVISIYAQLFRNIGWLQVGVISNSSPLLVKGVMIPSSWTKKAKPHNLIELILRSKVLFGKSVDGYRMAAFEGDPFVT